MEWKNLIDNEKGSASYRQKLDEIAAALMEAECEGFGLMGGKAGLSLFLFYYGHYVQDDKYADRGLELLDKIFDELNEKSEKEGYIYHTFAGGLAGAGWTVQHMVNRGFLDADTDEMLGEINPYLHKTMIYDIQNKNYDYLHGALGVALFFLERPACDETGKYLAELVDEMDKIAHKEDDGTIKWKSVLDRETGMEGFNLSLSHGISSIIAVLSLIYERGINREKTAALLEGAVGYLLKQELKGEQYHSVFPSWVSDKPPHNSRLAWCYGDLGNLLALWHAGVRLGKQEWQDKAKEILLHSAKRRDIQQNALMDAGLCHGTAGLGHIYTRMYWETGLEECKDTALYWYNEALKMATYEDGAAGFKAWHTEQYGGWVSEVGFLEGISGIGLGLLCLVSDIEAHWDRALLMS